MNRAIGLSAVLMTFIIGCASLESNAYKVIGTTAVTVDMAMNGWGDYVRAGKASSTDQNTVRHAYEQYQLAMSGAHQAVIAYRSGTNRTTLNIALDVLDATKNTLIEIITKSKTQ